MRTVDLHQLEAAVAVAENGSFTRAAGELHLTQPALSYAVAKLEAELGVELFRRGGRTVHVTTSGEAFLAGARETLRGADRLRATMAEISGVVSGRLEVAAPRTLVRRMALYVGAFRRSYPGVIVQLDDAEGDDAALDSLRAGDCELALLRRPELPADIEGDPLAPEEFAAVFPQGTPLGPGDRISLAQLAQHPLVAPPRGTANRAAFEQLFHSQGLSITVAVESAHPESILELVWAGAGASLASRQQAESLLSQGIVVRQLRPRMRTVVYLARRGSRLSPAGAAFRNMTLYPAGGPGQPTGADRPPGQGALSVLGCPVGPSGGRVGQPIQRLTGLQRRLEAGKDLGPPLADALEHPGLAFEAVMKHTVSLTDPIGSISNVTFEILSFNSSAKTSSVHPNMPAHSHWYLCQV